MTAKCEQEARLEQLAQGCFAPAKAALLELLAIPSVEGESQNNAPFGTEVAKALQKTADIATKLGLKTHLTPYYLTVDLGDTDGADAVGVLSHIDVVPFGSGWQFSPLGQQVDDKIYGRGSLDDKGPTVAALFALAALKQSGLPLGRPIRMIIGGNEESGSRCIAQYAQENPAPAFGFSPDANFPVIFAEKGITLFSADFTTTPGKLQQISAGTVVNAVPALAEAIISGISAASIPAALPDDIQLAFNEGRLQLSENTDATVTLRAIGKAAHGSMPEKGENAVWLLLKALGSLPLAADELAACAALRELFGSDYYGQGIGADCRDTVSGPLTLNFGTLHMAGGLWHAGLDIRYPVTADFAVIWQIIEQNAAKHAFSVKINEHKEPLYVPVDADPAAKLLALYREYEPDAEALAIGGGTYCRAFKNFVAFGPLRPQTADLMHQADEYITEEDLRFLLEIYTKALWRLAAGTCQ